MCLEPSPKVFLQNRLVRSRTKLQELESVLGAKREGAYILVTRDLTHTPAGDEVEQYTTLIASYSADNTLGNIDDAVNVWSSIVGCAYS